MEWTQECDLLLLQEIVVSQPYKFKPSTRDRGQVWEGITARLNATELFHDRLRNKRAVRDRYQLLSKKFKNKMAEEERASGISPEMTETDKLLEQIVEQFEESERDAGEQSEKNDQNKEKGRRDEKQVDGEAGGDSEKKGNS